MLLSRALRRVSVTGRLFDLVEMSGGELDRFGLAETRAEQVVQVLSKPVSGDPPEPEWVECLNPRIWNRLLKIQTELNNTERFLELLAIQNRPDLQKRHRSTKKPEEGSAWRGILRDVGRHFGTSPLDLWETFPPRLLYGYWVEVVRDDWRRRADVFEAARWKVKEPHWGHLDLRDPDQEAREYEAARRMYDDYAKRGLFRDPREIYAEIAAGKREAQGFGKPRREDVNGDA